MQGGFFLVVLGKKVTVWEMVGDTHLGASWYGHLCLSQGPVHPRADHSVYCLIGV